MAEPARSRRSVIKAIALGVAGAAGLWRFLTPRARPGSGAAARTITVPASEVPADGALVLPQFGLAVVRDGAALLAVDLTCTHLGCTVTATASGFACPCHGSRFSCRGECRGGPANQPLHELPAEEENGIVRVANDRGAERA